MKVENIKDENKTTEDIIKSIPESEMRKVVDSTKFKCKVETLPGVPTSEKLKEFGFSFIRALSSAGGAFAVGPIWTLSLPITTLQEIIRGNGKLINTDGADVMSKEDAKHYNSKLQAGFKMKVLSLPDDKGKEHNIQIAMTRANKIITGAYIAKKWFDKKFIFSLLFRNFLNNFAGFKVMNLVAKGAITSTTQAIGRTTTAAFGFEWLSSKMPWMNSWMQDEDFMVFKMIKDNKKEIGAEFMLLSTDMRMYKLILREHKKGSFKDIQMAVSEDNKYVLIKL